jgi:hypothetical protein
MSLKEEQVMVRWFKSVRKRISRIAQTVKIHSSTHLALTVNRPRAARGCGSLVVLIVSA